MNTKQCKKCQESKPLSDFYKAKYGYELDGHDYYCKFCRVGTSLKSQRGGNKKPCSVSECEMVHYAKGLCRKHYTRMSRNGVLESLNGIVEENKTYKYAKQELNYRRAYMLMYKYKLTIEQFDEMKKDGCNICGDTHERSMQVDHDHACCTGEGATCGNCVRGVVCNRCNQTIGKYETGLIRNDNPYKDNVAEYLMKYNNKRYDEDKHNAIIADNLQEFLRKANHG